MQLLSLRETLRLIENEAAKFSNKLPHFPEGGVEHMAAVLSLVPPAVAAQLLNAKLLFRAYPFALVCDDQQVYSIWQMLQRFNIQAMPEAVEASRKKLKPSLQQQQQMAANPTSGQLRTSLTAAEMLSVWESESLSNGDLHAPDETLALGSINVGAQTSAGRLLSVSLSNASDGTLCDVQLVGGAGPLNAQLSGFIETELHRKMLVPLLLDFAAGRDCCIVGRKGAGKSAFVRYAASRLGYDSTRLHTVHLFGDMSSRDLLQRRTTDEQGNTTWQTTPLVAAALRGDLAVLDGVERLPAAALAVLRTLIEDRELTLFDGTRLMRHDRYDRLRQDYTEEQLKELKVRLLLASHLLWCQAPFFFMHSFCPPVW